ncbi:MAG: hypothetical protein SAJ12_19920 [Jaaginema sp. PMC 1079.18]|nr:hypothetical protein [Jaaginema sp. PMC 1080.18]MEC4853255.1 hypothetical protein [Jaaginema sp. PMC 1079.18]MEC4868058.1 hypothetical protein [Jaaginema sp. PMC 1078.18]
MTSDSQFPLLDDDAAFEKQLQRLYELSLQRRWRILTICWFTLGIYGLWGLRQEISLGLDYFTLALVHYSLVFDPIPSFCLGFCLFTTITTLLSQSRHILFGFSTSQRRQLARELQRIRALGKSHPLWKKVCG